MEIGIQQKAAPLRLGFLILPENEASLINAMKIAFSSWGGIFAPIIPFYEELPIQFRSEFQINISTKDFYDNTFKNYDVDILIYDNDINPMLLSGFMEERNVMSVNEFLFRNSKIEDLYGIPITAVADLIADKEFKFTRNDKKKFCIPDIPQNEPFLNAWCGILTKEANDAVTDIFSKYKNLVTPKVDWNCLVAYKTDEHLDIITLNKYEISIWPNTHHKFRVLFYAFNSRRLQDIINFWNLRAAGNIVLPILIDTPEQAVNKYIFDKYYKRLLDSKSNYGIIIIDCLLAHQCNSDLLTQLRTEYHAQNPAVPIAQFGIQTWFPRFWGEHEFLIADNIKSITPICDSQFEHYNVKDDQVEFLAQPLPFNIPIDHNGRNGYKLLIENTLYDESSEYAGLLDGITRKQVRKLINPLHIMEDWRISAATLHRPISVDKADSRILIWQPKSLDFFTIFFSNKGYMLTETPNSKLAKEVFKNIGGIFGAMYYLNKERLKIIESFEGGSDILYSTLVGDIKKNLGNKYKEEQFIGRLLENKIIEFGAKIKCSVCEQSGFFLPGDIVSNLTCPICRNSFRLPMEKPNRINWAYRGIGPFTRSNKADGVMSVFATLRLFKREISNDNRISSLIGFELVKTGIKDSNKKEVDLCLLVGHKYDQFQKPDLVFCECKTYINFKAVDMERMMVLGKEFPGAVLVFATLNETLTDEEKALIGSLVQNFQTGNGKRPRNPVLVLTGKELLPDEPSDPLRDYEDTMHAYQYHNDYLGALCELSVRKHLGIQNWWEKKELERIQEINRKRQIGRLIKSVLIQKVKNYPK